MKMGTSRKSGFTLLEIMIVVTLIGTMAAIGVPNMIKARSESQKDICINNLRQINSAIQQWAVENRQPIGASVAETDVTPYMRNKAICPAGGSSFTDSYLLNTVADGAVCLKAPATHILP